MIYHSFEQLDIDIQTAKLQRDIAAEELKATREDFSESLQPNQWLATALGFLKKYGMLYVIKRIFK